MRSVRKVEKDSVDMMKWELFFCLFAVWQRGEATAVQIVWAILHDHPICQSLGVWLALWLQFFSGDCVGPWIWIAHTGWLILWGLVLLREKKMFYSHNKSAELFIATNHSIISSHFTGCTVCWNKQSPGSCWECQDANISERRAIGTSPFSSQEVDVVIPQFGLINACLY